MGDSVLGFAKAKFKGFCTYSEAAACMSSSGYSDFNVYDRENTYSKSAYEQSRGHQSCKVTLSAAEKDMSENQGRADQLNMNTEQQDTIPTVYIHVDGSCIRNGASTAQAGYGLFWGDEHPWNFSCPLTQDGAATNNKAELAAAVKALQMARDNNLEELIIYSDSKYVVQGVTEWIHKWKENGWKTAGGDDVKNKDIWMELASLAEKSTTKITWKHVAAHAGVSGNEEADKLAVNAAKMNTTDNPSSGVRCSDTICQAVEKPIITNAQPKVIVIQKKITPIPITTATQPVLKITETPSRKAARDRSDTPVPGAMNGSSVGDLSKSASHQGEKSKGKAVTSTGINESIEDTQTLKIMTNMETIMATIMTELHQLREDQLEFKNEVKQEISGIKEKQQENGKSVSNLSKEVKDDIRSCVMKIEQLAENSKREPTIDHGHVELKTAVVNLQKKVDSRLDLTSSTIQALETSITSARSGMEKISRDCATELYALDTKSTQITEKLTEIQTDIKRTGHTLTEVEKSLTSLSEKDEFTRPSKAMKERPCDVEIVPVIDNKFAELTEEDESDDEVIFKGQEPGKKTDFKSTSTQVSDIPNEKITPEKSTNKPNNSKETFKDAESKSDSDRPRTYTRKEMVYLVGDSISGQVNPAILGKSTRTYVKKLKAAKIEDLHSMTDQVKDAKMIIIHTGINNLRGKESSADSRKSLIESITSFREAAPESKIVVSKVIPTGDHEIDIERNIFNAENEKRLTEINKSGISFIDHGNLAERGIPIKEYYRPDLIHLAGRGVAVFADNLEKEIVRVLKSGEQQLETETENTAQLSRSRDMNTGNRNHRSYQLAYNGDGQYNQQHRYPEERDQRRNTYRGNQPRMHPDSNGFSGYPSRTMRDNTIEITTGATRETTTEMTIETMTGNITEVAIIKTIRESIHIELSVIETIRVKDLMIGMKNI